MLKLAESGEAEGFTEPAGQNPARLEERGGSSEWAGASTAHSHAQVPPSCTLPGHTHPQPLAREHHYVGKSLGRTWESKQPIRISYPRRGNQWGLTGIGEHV